MANMMQNNSFNTSDLPGNLLNNGDENNEEVKISLFTYSEDSFVEKSIDKNNIRQLILNPSEVHWLAVEGIHDFEVINDIGKIFGLHPIVLEDILTTNQRPKIENYENYIYVVVKILLYDKTINEFTTEQERFILGENFIISFSERDLVIYDPIQDRLRKCQGHIRKSGPDYLLYSLLDIIVDNYFHVLEKISDEIELAEDELILSPSKEAMQVIHKFKRQMLFMHKAIWPLREVLGGLQRNELTLIKENTGVYIRDLYGHIIQMIDTVETLRDILSSMLDMYLSSISNKMNEVMKILTIISTVFIPLTFIVGVYGMNFKYMPELYWAPMYPLLWVFMLVIVAGMLTFFKKKKWW